jgi:hypothetical protein
MATKKSDEESNPKGYFSGPKGHPKDRIVIHEAVDIPREGMFISLNGYPYLIKPGEEVDVPRPVRDMLDTRIVTITSHDESGKEYTKDIKRVNYTLIKQDVDAVEAV